MFLKKYNLSYTFTNQRKAQKHKIEIEQEPIPTSQDVPKFESY